jgi:hypothetical protein
MWYNRAGCDGLSESLATHQHGLQIAVLLERLESTTQTLITQAE